MTAKKANERKKEERARKRAQGLSPVEVWVAPHDKPAIKTLESKLQKKWFKENQELEHIEPGEQNDEC